MAIIGNIRNRMGLLITVVVGLALLSFILQDLFSGKYSSNKGGQVTDIAEVSGEAISYREFEEKFQANLISAKTRSRNGQVDEEQERENTWTQMLNERVMQKEFDKLGILVSKEELADMIGGENVHEVIKSNFTDPKTNQFNPMAVKQFLDKYDELPLETQNLWIELEEYILKDRINQKYNNLVSKGLYVTQAEAKRAFNDQQKEIKFEYVVKRYSEIADSTLQVTDAEIKEYYEKHKDQNYKKDEPSRKLEYVMFDVFPSASDSEAVLKRSTELLTEFQQTKDDSLFVSLNSENPFDDAFRMQSELSGILDSTLFKAPTGTVYGPYVEDGYYKIAKVIARTTRPDSVQARHILLRPSEQADLKTVQARIDSIKQAIEGGAPFEMLAMKYSQDGSKDKGGDLGTFAEGQMVKPFNEACFTGKKGQLQVVNTQFGVHLIEVTKIGTPKEKVKIGIIETKIEPSSTTRNMVYNKASKFARENTSGEAFEKAVAEQGLNKRVVDEVKKGMRNITGLESSRDLVKWAWNANADEVRTEPFEFGDKMVVPHLAAVYDDGYVSLDELKEEIEVAVKKEKKAEKLIAELSSEASSAGSLQALASKLGLMVDTLEHVKFTSRGLPGLGRELELIGTVFALPTGKISSPIKGEQGVYIVQVENISEVTQPEDYKQNKEFLARNLQSRVGYEVYKALEKNANVVDNRASFY